jgi:long-chain acyl-CoA synthetase
MSQQDPTLLDLLERQAKSAPGSAAVLTPQKSVSYQELVDGARRVASALLKATQQPVVALFFPMCPEFVTAYFGVLYAGKAALPLNLLLPPEDLKYILQDSGADVIVAPPDFAAKLAPLGVKVLSCADLFSAGLAGELPRPTPADMATLLYTSGTTGKPKGVELTHHNLASNAASAVDAMRLTPGHRLLACLPSFHTFAITGTMLAPLAAGASLATMPKFDPEGVLATTAELKCNTLMMVPSMYRLITRMQERKKLDLAHVKLAIAGGEALPSEIADNFEKVFGIPLLQGYGQTESAPVVSFNLPWDNQPGTVGKPIKDVQVRIVNPDTLKDAAPETGEIWIKGPNVMRGYHNKPEETAQALTADGWLRTGDMGELTSSGFLRITGRLREMIKMAGEMVFPAEVENALLQHPAIFEAGVAGAKDERKGEIVKAFVVLKPGETASEADLLAHCRTLLAGYKVPKVIEFRPELPKGPTGKVMRRLLK